MTNQISRNVRFLKELHKHQYPGGSVAVLGSNQEEYSAAMEDWDHDGILEEDNCDCYKRRHQSMVEELQKTIDSSRTNRHLSTSGNFALVAALITSSSLMTMTNLAITDTNMMSLVLSDLTLITSALSTILGAYAVINFALCALDGVPLGMGKDSSKDSFVELQDTLVKTDENLAFKAFLGSSAFFVSKMICVAASTTLH